MPKAASADSDELALLLARFNLRIHKHVVGVLWTADHEAIPVVVEDDAPPGVTP